MNDNIRNEIAALLVEGFGGKPFTYAQLSKALGDKLTSRRLAYKVMGELVATGYVERVKVAKKDAKVAGWQIPTADEETAISLYELYLAE